MIVEVMLRESVKLKDSARRRIAAAQDKHLCVACLEPFTNGEQPVRGCHRKCYVATRRLIEAGDCTDGQRVREGKLLAPKSPGRKPTNPVTIEARA